MKLKKYLYKSVTSTNDIAIKKIKQGLSKGFIVAKNKPKVEADMAANGFI